MAQLRSTRFEERKARTRLILAAAGTLALVIFLVLFGLKILVGFSLLVDKLRGNSPAPASQTQSFLSPPVLDPLPEATNSAQIKVSGHGQAGLTAIVYLNGAETKKLTIDQDGSFKTTVTVPGEGDLAVSAKVLDGKGNTSDLSEVMHIMINSKAPIMEVTSPQDGAAISGDDNKILVTGKVGDDIQVTVNDRLVVVQNNGSFSYKYPLPEGDTILKIVATDSAGNQTKIERKVTYKK